jgi:RNA polymerase sigma factor (sigma-70 family)
MEGLCLAVAFFNPTRGTTFTTYAQWWIRERVADAKHRHMMINIPKHHFARREEKRLKLKSVDATRLPPHLRTCHNIRAKIDFLVTQALSIERRNPHGPTLQSVMDYVECEQEDRHRELQALDKALQYLDSVTRKVLRLHYNGVSFRKLSEQLDLRLNTVKTIHRHGIAKLRRLMR